MSPAERAAQIAAQRVEAFQLTEEPSFPALLEHLYATRYNGEVTLHFHNGKAKVVEFIQSVKVSLAQGT